MLEESEDAVNKAIDSVVELNRKYYQITDQSDAACFFYPNPVENTPVVFRGQCESVNVQAMGSFNVGNVSFKNYISKHRKALDVKKKNWIFVNTILFYTGNYVPPRLRVYEDIFFNSD